MSITLIPVQDSKPSLSVKQQKWFSNEEPDKPSYRSIESITMNVKLSASNLGPLDVIKLKSGGKLLSGTSGILTIFKDEGGAWAREKGAIGFMECLINPASTPDNIIIDGDIISRFGVRLFLAESEYYRLVSGLGSGYLPSDISIAGEGLESGSTPTIMEWDDVKYPKIILNDVEIKFPIKISTKGKDITAVSANTNFTSKSFQKILPYLIFGVVGFGILFLIMQMRR